MVAFDLCGGCVVDLLCRGCGYESEVKRDFFSRISGLVRPYIALQININERLLISTCSVCVCVCMCVNVCV